MACEENVDSAALTFHHGELVVAGLSVFCIIFLEKYPVSTRKNEMSKAQRAKFIVVLETLKACDCIAGYTIVGQDVIPEWKERGTDRVVNELIANQKPFGLKTTQRAWLFLVLPQKDRERVDAVIFGRLKDRF